MSLSWPAGVAVYGMWEACAVGLPDRPAGADLAERGRDDAHRRVYSLSAAVCVAAVVEAISVLHSGLAEGHGGAAEARAGRADGRGEGSMPLNEYQVCAEALAKWGPESQIVMLFEEMAELQKEVCKAYRKETASIAEEIADVEIMLVQLKLLFDVFEEVEKWKMKKLERLKERIERG